MQAGVTWEVSWRRLEREMSFVGCTGSDQMGEEAKDSLRKGVGMSDPSIGYAL